MNKVGPNKVALIDIPPDQWVAFERMLADLSARFANVPHELVESEIQQAQVVLREFLGFDRSSFAEFQEDGSLDVLSTTAIEGVDTVSLGRYRPEFNWYHRQLLAGETIVWRASDVLPSEAAAEIKYVRNVKLRAQLSIPLRIAGKIFGVIGFASFRDIPSWPDDLITRIKLVGEVFAQALFRKRDQEKLLAAMSEVRVLKDRLEREHSYLRETAQLRPALDLTSRSRRFMSVLDELRQVSPTNATVLLLGETGSGKEVLAQAIHNASNRKDRPMIKVNCAALPATLIAAFELFAMTHPGERTTQFLGVALTALASGAAFLSSGDPRLLVTMIVVVPLAGPLLTLLRLGGW